MRINNARRSHPIDLRSTIMVMLVAFAFGLTLPSTSYASTLYVCAATDTQCQSTTFCQGSACYASIANAIGAASPDDTISVLDADLSESNIVVDKNLTIEGLGASSTIVDGGGSTSASPGPVFTIDGGVTATIQDMTVTGGYDSANGGGIVNNGGTLTIRNTWVLNNTADPFNLASGGGIANLYGGSVWIDKSTVSGNTAYYGGGVLNSSGTFTITNSTFSGNQAPSGYGGAIYNADTVMISFSTIATNSALSGGGIYNYSTGTATVDNSIIGENTTGGDCAGTSNAPSSNPSVSLDTDGTCGTGFTSVTSTQLNLGPLVLNSPGTTETMALLSGSPAIDQALNCNGYDSNGNIVPVTTDQRGVSRPQPTGGACDIGAYELQQGTSPVTTVTDFGVPGTSNDSPTGAKVTMGAFIHDNATVTLTNSIPSPSSVAFNFFPNASCSSAPSSTDTEPLKGGTLSESVESTTQGPLAIGGVSYQAVFSADPSTPSPCEPLNVQSPISKIFYTVVGDSSPTQYTCTVGQTCSSLNPAYQNATVGVSTTYVVDVEVTNLTGINGITEYVQGTLPSGKNFSYTSVSTSPNCGGAVVKGNGDVLWNATGSHSPNASGFLMSEGQVCDLQVTIAATFSTSGQQAIAGPWYTTQTETSPVPGQSVPPLTSPSTGSLAVNVQ